MYAPSANLYTITLYVRDDVSDTRSSLNCNLFSSLSSPYMHLVYYSKYYDNLIQVFFFSRTCITKCVKRVSIPDKVSLSTLNNLYNIALHDIMHVCFVRQWKYAPCSTWKFWKFFTNLNFKLLLFCMRNKSSFNNIILIQITCTRFTVLVLLNFSFLIRKQKS